MCERLVEVLKRVGKSTEIYETPGGTRVLLLAYGARILGLFARGSDENFYWTHPELEKVESARGLYESDNWHNSGGTAPGWRPRWISSSLTIRTRECIARRDNWTPRITR